MVRLGGIVLNVSDIDRAATFWSGALGYERDGAFLRSRTGDGPILLLDEDDRSHLDLWAADEKEQEAEVERLIGLGATRVEWNYPEGADFVVLADPDGTLFCVVA